MIRKQALPLGAAKVPAKQRPTGMAAKLTETQTIPTMTEWKEVVWY